MSGRICTYLKQLEKPAVGFFSRCATDFKIVMETFAACHHSSNYTRSFWLDTQCWGEDLVAQEEGIQYTFQSGSSQPHLSECGSICSVCMVVVVVRSP